MNTTTHELSSDPAVHSQKIREELTDLINHCRDDVMRVPEPRFQALLETSAEVLAGLKTAFEHYDRHHEKAWQQ